MTKILSKERLVPLGIGLVLGVVVYLGLSWIVVALALRADVTPFAFTPDEVGLAHEEVSFSPRGDDSITLRGWWIPNDEPVGTVIYVHGLDKNRAERLPLLAELHGEGLSVLTFDLRGHGESDDVRSGAGYYERQDVRGAIDFVLTEQGAEPGTVILFGKSFGAAASLLGAVGEESLAGVFADSSFASLGDVMISEVSDRTFIPRFLANSLRPGITWMGRWTAGIDIGAVQPVAAAAELTIPIGIAHCTLDERVPVQDALALRSVAQAGYSMTLFRECEHAKAYDLFTPEYTDLVINYSLVRLGVIEE